MLCDGSRLERQAYGLLVHFHVRTCRPGSNFPRGGLRGSQPIEIPQERLTGRRLSQRNALVSGIGEMLNSARRYWSKIFFIAELERPNWRVLIALARRIGEINEIGVVG